jgi:hypothetical protein
MTALLLAAFVIGATIGYAANRRRVAALVEELNWARYHRDDIYHLRDQLDSELDRKARWHRLAVRLWDRH